MHLIGGCGWEGWYWYGDRGNRGEGNTLCLLLLVNKMTNINGQGSDDGWERICMIGVSPKLKHGGD